MRLSKLGLMIVLTTVMGMQVEVSEENEEIIVKAEPLEVTVLDSASFDMSAIGASSVNLRLDKIKGQGQLQLVARERLVRFTDPLPSEFGNLAR